MLYMQRCLCVSGILLFWLTGCVKDDPVEETGRGSVYAVTRPPVPPPAKPSVELRISHMAGGELLAYDVKYLNAWGEKFTVDVLKYYLTNIVLVYDSVTRVMIPETYFLVDQSKTVSRTIRLTGIPSGTLTGIEFLVGVDAFRNSQGVQTGDLDPVLGMFWTWNSGYIMAKLEGRYERPGRTDGSYIWHCGSATPPYSSTRSIALNITSVAADTLQKTVIELNGDVLEWFKTPHTTRIADTPVFNDATSFSSKVADNYADMFSVKNVRREPF
jgi:hypothetical protein